MQMILLKAQSKGLLLRCEQTDLGAPRQGGPLRMAPPPPKELPPTALGQRFHLSLDPVSRRLCNPFPQQTVQLLWLGLEQSWGNQDNGSPCEASLNWGSG